MNKINWTVRFSKENKAFYFRLLLSVAVPVLGYFGLKFEDLTSWGSVFDVLVKALANPYVLGLTVVNVLNVIPDPTTKGFGDSYRALSYESPADDSE